MEPLKLKRVFVDDAMTYDDEPCAGVVYLEPDQEWESGDFLENYWHIERHAAGGCGEYYLLTLENSGYMSDDETLSELARLEAHLFEWISDENDERNVELNT